MADSPVVVLVPGGFHGSWVWAPLIERLTAAGLQTATIDLPSLGSVGDELPGLSADADALSALLDSIPGEKVVLAHSYGGAVMTAATGGRSDIRHIIYAAAFAPDAGENVLQVFEPAPEWMGPSTDGRYVEIKPDTDVISTCYAHVDPKAASEAEAQLSPVHGIGVVVEPVVTAGWRTIPSTYVISTDDKAVDPELQRRFASNMTVAIELDTDHSPMLSATTELADIVISTVRI